MPFKALLKEMIERVPGAQGAVIADWEGEAVDQFGLMDDYDLKLIGAYKGVILTNMRDVANRLNNDQLKEIIITTEHAQMIVVPVNLEYFLVLTLNRSDVLGRALFEARRCLQALKDEIA
jgi:predicted regulator of Ras-like GTPase activity (Roadblock/LC7/MglB family)